MQTNTQVQMTLDKFNETLQKITRTSQDTRKHICVAFRAAMNDLFYSKSTERLNMLARVVSPLSEWSKVKSAVFVFAGGYDLDMKALIRYRNPDAACVRWDREKLFVLTELPKAEFDAAQARFELIKTFDFDSVQVKQRPSGGLDLSGIVKQVQKLAQDPQKWNPEHEKAISLFLCRIGDVPGLGHIELPAKAKELYAKQAAK